MHKRYALVFILALVGASADAEAQGYFGLGLGSSKADIRGDAEEVIGLLGGICGVNASCSFDESDTGFKVFGGRRLNPNFAFEGFYVDLGEASASATDGVSTLTLSADASAFGVAAVGMIPVSSSLDLLGKVGFARWSADVSVSFTGLGSASESDDGTDPFFGIGVQWNGDAVSLRGEFERFDLDGTDVDLTSVSLIFRF